MQSGFFSVMLVVSSSLCWGAENPSSQPAEEPDPAAASRGPDPLRLRFSDLYLGFESDLQYRRVRSSTTDRRDTLHKNTDMRFLEYVGLRTDGEIYDPNLIAFEAGGEFGLRQSRYRESFDSVNQTDNDDGFLLRYDLSLDVLRNKPVSFHAYARRNDDRIDRRFLPSLREEQTEAGASALILTGPITTEVGWSYRDIDRHGNNDREDDESLTTKRFYVNSDWKISDTHQLRLSYDHEQEESSYQGSTYEYDTRRDELRLDHQLAFGEGNKHRLDTYIHYTDESGDLARDEFEFVPRLTLQHTDKFKTIWRYGYYSFDQGNLEFDQHKADVEAVYDVTKDLRLTGDVYALFERPDGDAHTNEFGGQVNADYRRDSSLGQLRLNGLVGYDETRTYGKDERRVVRREAHQLKGVRPVFLQKWPVVATSIVAYNEPRTRFYVVGKDYWVTLIRGRAQIERIPTGRITEEELVYFDYAYEVPVGAAVQSWRTDLLVEHEFKFGLTPYYRFEGRFQDVDSDSFGSPLWRDNQNRHRLGVRYDRTTWSLGTEYEIYDDSVEPYDAWHLNGQASLFRSPTHSLDLTSELSWYDFEGGYDSRDVWYFDIDVRDKLRITQWLSAFVGSEYRFEDDSRRGQMHGVDLKAGLQYVRGQLTVELTVEYDLLSIVDNREQGLGVFLNVRRSLTEFLPAGRQTR